MGYRQTASCLVLTCFFTGLLSGCAAAIFGAIPINIFTTEVIPRAINGKGLVEDGVDLATGKNCRLIEGTVRSDRKVCETKNSPATRKDFKGLSGFAPHDDDVESAETR